MLRVFQSVRGLSDDSVTRLDKNEDLALEMRDRQWRSHGGGARGGARAPPTPPGTTHEIHANPKTFFWGGGGRG